VQYQSLTTEDRFKNTALDSQIKSILSATANAGLRLLLLLLLAIHMPVTHLLLLPHSHQLQHQHILVALQGLNLVMHAAIMPQLQHKTAAATANLRQACPDAQFGSAITALAVLC
jgi:hypothetical protein